METFFASSEYARAVADQAKYVEQVSPLPERAAYTFVYNGQMTLVGQRGSRTAELITKLGATNQLRDDVRGLIVGAVTHNTPTARNGSGAGSPPGLEAHGMKPNIAQILPPFNGN